MKLDPVSDTFAIVGALLMAGAAGWAYPPAGPFLLGLLLFLIGVRSR